MTPFYSTPVLMEPHKFFVEQIYLLFPHTVLVLFVKYVELQKMNVIPIVNKAKRL